MRICTYPHTAAMISCLLVVRGALLMLNAMAPSSWYHARMPSSFLLEPSISCWEQNGLQT